MVSGERHAFLGAPYRLEIITAPGAAKVTLRGLDILELRVRPGADAAQRERVLQRWYRRQLSESIPPLLAKWQPRLGVQLSFCGIKKMKSKWGSCHRPSRRIWLNLELVKRSAASLEYIVVHELAHLIEPNHGARFKAILDEHLPDWRQRRKTLNATPMGHEARDY
jgi:predicted metal-dependent hydrolase